MNSTAPCSPPAASRPDSDLAAAPASWYYFGSKHEFARGPCSFELPGNRRFVGYLKSRGVPVVLAARCPHMGAEPARGCVHGDRIACPLHGWEFGSDGHCARIPVAEADEPPAFARQAAYPTIEHGGHIFFCNETRAPFPAPFFDGIDPAALRTARPFDLHDDVPWYFIGANGFDVQHFRNAHDRVLLDEPLVEPQVTVICYTHL